MILVSDAAVLRLLLYFGRSAWNLEEAPDNGPNERRVRTRQSGNKLFKTLDAGPNSFKQCPSSVSRKSELVLLSSACIDSLDPALTVFKTARADVTRSEHSTRK